MTWLKRQRPTWSRDERELPGGALSRNSSASPFYELWLTNELGA